MALKDKVARGKEPRPPRIVLYSIEGLGKSTFGASALKPIIQPTEDGLDELDVSRFPKPDLKVPPHLPTGEGFDQVISNLELLYNEKHDYKTYVLDTLDWLEPMIWEHVCAKHGRANIESFDYQKGFVYALDGWERLFRGLNMLRNERGMAIILIAHADVKRFDSPDVEPYDRYQIKLHRKAAAKVIEWCDALLFANYQVYTEETQVGFNKKVVRGTGGEDRFMYTEERPAYKAKNRYGLPHEMPFVKGEAWNTLVTAIKESRK